MWSGTGPLAINYPIGQSIRYSVNLVIYAWFDGYCVTPSISCMPYARIQRTYLHHAMRVKKYGSRKNNYSDIISCEFVWARVNRKDYLPNYYSRFRLKWRIKICLSPQKKSKQILAYEIAKNDIRKELYLLKNKAYNLRNFSTFAAILEILHPQCIAIVVRTLVKKCSHISGA